MLKIYMLIIVLGLLGGVGYGAYYYYKDTQQRIQVLSENNAKLEVAAQLQEETINTMIEDREKFEQINKELQKELQTAERYGDQLRATFLKLTGAIDVLSQIEQENNPQPPVEEGAPETAVSEEVPE